MSLVVCQAWGLPCVPRFPQICATARCMMKTGKGVLYEDDCAPIEMVAQSLKPWRKAIVWPSCDANAHGVHHCAGFLHRWNTGWLGCPGGHHSERTALPLWASLRHFYFFVSDPKAEPKKTWTSPSTPAAAAGSVLSSWKPTSSSRKLTCCWSNSYVRHWNLSGNCQNADPANVHTPSEQELALQRVFQWKAVFFLKWPPFRKTFVHFSGGNCSNMWPHKTFTSHLTLHSGFLPT